MNGCNSATHIIQLKIKLLTQNKQTRVICSQRYYIPPSQFLVKGCSDQAVDHSCWSDSSTQKADFDLEQHTAFTCLIFLQCLQVVQ